MSCLGSRWINEELHLGSEGNCRIWGANDNCWLGSGSDCELAVMIWGANVNCWLGSGERMAIVAWELLVRNGNYWLGSGERMGIVSNW